MILAPPPPAETAPAPVEVPKLAPDDTCDRCGPGTQALVRVRNSVTGAIIDFCLHHFRSHEPSLMVQGFEAVEQIEVPA